MVADEKRCRARITQTFSLRPEMVAALKELAVKEDRPVSYLVREAVERLFEQRGLR